MKISAGAEVRYAVSDKMVRRNGSDAERNLDAEAGLSEEIVKKVLLMQANAAAKQHRPLCRGTHAKGVCRARLNLRCSMSPSAAIPRWRRGSPRAFSRDPAIYPATVRFANSDPHVNSDFKPDVRSLSILRRPDA